MSGTKAHEKRVILKLEAERDKAVALSDNKDSILQITIAELINLYGADNVKTEHPLFSAIQRGAKGAMIDLEQLSADIIEFDKPEVV